MKTNAENFDWVVRLYITEQEIELAYMDADYERMLLFVRQYTDLARKGPDQK